MERDPVHRIAKAGLAGGAQRRSDDVRRPTGGQPAATWEWDVAGVCEKPVTVVRWWRPRDRAVMSDYIGVDAWGTEHRKWIGPVETRGYTWSPGKPQKLEVTLQVPCRKCDTCRKKRAGIWAMRALTEIQRAPGRTWFGTLEFAPEERTKAMARARLKMKRRASGDFDALSPERKGSALIDAVSPQVTNYFKRLRKGGPVPVEDGVFECDLSRWFEPAEFRYLCVAEFHKLCGECKKARLKPPCPHATWFPHFHVLLHEYGPPIVKDNLEGRWDCGFEQWRLVEDDAEARRRRAFYVAKYIAKEAGSRVRCSLHYGHL